MDEAFQQVITNSPETPLKDDIPPTKDALAQRILFTLRQPHQPQDKDEK
jgi:hypothetical protein